MLQQFDLVKLIILQTDTSGFAILGILKQYDGFMVHRLVNIYSRKCSAAEQIYDTYDRKLFAIVETLKQWRHYLERANKKVSIQCDQENVHYFHTSKVHGRSQARWSDVLSASDYVMKHLEGSYNMGDGPSRRPDYKIGYERPVSQPLATVSVKPYDNLMPAMILAEASDPLAADVSAKHFY